MRYFVAVADTLNFSRASEALFISQSALSKQISELEQELGVTLFERDKRNVIITKAGQLLLSEAKEILMRLEKFTPMLRHEATESPQKLFIGIDPRVADDYTTHCAIAESVYSIRRQNPGLRVLFFKRDFSDMKKELLEGKLDLCFTLHSEMRMDESVESMVLSHDEMVLAFRSSIDYSDDIESVREILEKRGVILMERELHGMAHILNIFNAIGSQPRIRFCGSATAMLMTMESGESTAVLPASLAKRLGNSHLRVLHFRDPSTALHLLAGWRKGEGESMAMEIAEASRERLHSMDDM